MSTEITADAVTIVTETDAEQELFDVTMAIAHDWASEMMAHSINGHQLNIIISFQSRLNDLGTLLKTNPQFQRSHGVVHFAVKLLIAFLDHIYEHVTCWDADPSQPLGIIADYRALSELLGDPTEWLDPIQTAFESRVEHDEEDDDDWS